MRLFLWLVGRRIRPCVLLLNVGCLMLWKTLTGPAARLRALASDVSLKVSAVLGVRVLRMSSLFVVMLEIGWMRRCLPVECIMFSLLVVKAMGRLRCRETIVGELGAPRRLQVLLPKTG